MAKKPSSPPASARQAKIEAARGSGGSGANKIVVAAVVTIVAIIAVVGGVIWAQQSQEDAVTGGGNALPVGVTALGAGFPGFAEVTPAAGAPTLDVYADFQCPACAQFESVLGPTVVELGTQGKAKVVYHMKNFLDDNLGNDSSTRAANAAFCAADAGKFEEYHTQVFANQPATEGDGFTDAQLASFAEASGITGEELTTWQRCVDAGKYVDYVNSVEAQSFEDGVRGTPTIRINGEIVELQSVGSPELLTQAIQNATT